MLSAVAQRHPLPVTQVAKRIEHRGRWWVVIADSGRVMGKYRTKAEAQARLRQIEHYSKAPGLPLTQAATWAAATDHEAALTAAVDGVLTSWRRGWTRAKLKELLALAPGTAADALDPARPDLGLLLAKMPGIRGGRRVVNLTKAVPGDEAELMEVLLRIMLSSSESAGWSVARSDQTPGGWRLGEDTSQLDLDGLFRVISPEAVAYARNQSAALVSHIDDAQRALIRQVIAWGQAGEATVGQMADVLYSSIGLHPRQAIAANNLRNLLNSIRLGTSAIPANLGQAAAYAASPGGALAPGPYSLLGAPAGGVAAAPAGSPMASIGYEMAEEVVEEVVESYIERLRGHRARMIARTETMRAANNGLLAGWNDAVAEGWIDPDEAWVEWVVHPDDRLCSVCRDLAQSSSPEQITGAADYESIGARRLGPNSEPFRSTQPLPDTTPKPPDVPKPPDRFDPDEWAGMDMTTRRNRWGAMDEPTRDRLADPTRTIPEAQARLLDGMDDWPTDLGDLDDDAVREALRRRIRGATDRLPQSDLDMVDSFVDRLWRDMRRDGIDRGDAIQIAQDVTDTTLAQSIESLGRTLGDHGIHHIAQDADYAIDMLAELGENSPRVRSMARITSAFHDAGYLAPPSHIFLDEGHPRWSGMFFDSQERGLIEHAYGADWGQRISELLPTHDYPDVDWIDDPFGTAFRVSDNMALFHAEKFPPFMRHVPETTGSIIRLGQGSITAAQAADEVRQAILRRVDLPVRVQAQLLRSADEITDFLPKASLGMVGARAKSFTWDRVAQTMVIDIERHKANEALGRVLDLYQNQFRKLAKTYGLDPDAFVHTGVADFQGQLLLRILDELEKALLALLKADAPAPGSETVGYRSRTFESPPAHPGCRCTMVLHLDTTSRPVTSRTTLPGGPDDPNRIFPDFAARRRRVEDELASARDHDLWPEGHPQAGLPRQHVAENGNWDPARLGQQEGVIDDLFAGAASVPRDRSAIVTSGGAPPMIAAGLDPDAYLDVTPDRVLDAMARRGMIQPRGDLSPMEMASLYQGEADYIAQGLLTRALDAGVNVRVGLPLDGRDVDDLLRSLNANDYLGQMLHVDLSDSDIIDGVLTGWGDGVQRWLTGRGLGGRYVNPADAVADAAAQREMFQRWRSLFSGSTIVDGSTFPPRIINRTGIWDVPGEAPPITGMFTASGMRIGDPIPEAATVEEAADLLMAKWGRGAFRPRADAPPGFAVSGGPLIVDYSGWPVEAANRANRTYDQMFAEYPELLDDPDALDFVGTTAGFRDAGYEWPWEMKTDGRPNIHASAISIGPASVNVARANGYRLPRSIVVDEDNWQRATLVSPRSWEAHGGLSKTEEWTRRQLVMSTGSQHWPPGYLDLFDAGWDPVLVHEIGHHIHFRSEGPGYMDAIADVWPKDRGMPWFAGFRSWIDEMDPTGKFIRHTRPSPEMEDWMRLAGKYSATNEHEVFAESFLDWWAGRHLDLPELHDRPILRRLGDWLDHKRAVRVQGMGRRWGWADDHLGAVAHALDTVTPTPVVLDIHDVARARAHQALLELADRPGTSLRFADGAHPQHGFMVSVEGAEADFDSLDLVDEDALSTFIEDHRILLEDRDDTYIGVWVDPDDGHVYLDVSQNIDREDIAVDLGFRQHQISVYDVDHDSYIYMRDRPEVGRQLGIEPRGDVPDIVVGPRRVGRASAEVSVGLDPGRVDAPDDINVPSGFPARIVDRHGDAYDVRIRHNPRMGNEARYLGRGQVEVGPEFGDLDPGTQDAILWHELGHEIDESGLLEGWGWDVVDMVPEHGLNGQTTPGEIIAEAFSIIRSDDVAEAVALGADPRLFDLVADLADRRLDLDRRAMIVDHLDRDGVPFGGSESQLLRTLADEADEIGVPIRLTVDASPVGDVRNWYERHGFTLDPDNDRVWVRQPGADPVTVVGAPDDEWQMLAERATARWEAEFPGASSVTVRWLPGDDVRVAGAAARHNGPFIDINMDEWPTYTDQLTETFGPPGFILVDPSTGGILEHEYGHHLDRALRERVEGIPDLQDRLDALAAIDVEVDGRRLVLPERTPSAYAAENTGERMGELFSYMRRYGDTGPQPEVNDAVRELRALMRETDITPTPGRIGLPDADDYRGAHQPTADYGARADDLTDMAFDFYEHPEFYPGGPEYPEVVAELRRVHGDPDATITIYRAVPGDVEVINPGDWVTPSRRYAQEHADAHLGPDARVVELRVRAGDLVWPGDYMPEFGYFPDAPPIRDLRPPVPLPDADAITSVTRTSFAEAAYQRATSLDVHPRVARRLVEDPDAASLAEAVDLWTSTHIGSQRMTEFAGELTGHSLYRRSIWDPDFPQFHDPTDEDLYSALRLSREVRDADISPRPVYHAEDWSDADVEEFLNPGYEFDEPLWAVARDRGAATEFLGGSPGGRRQGVMFRLDDGRVFDIPYRQRLVEKEGITGGRFRVLSRRQIDDGPFAGTWEVTVEQVEVFDPDRLPIPRPDAARTADDVYYHITPRWDREDIAENGLFGSPTDDGPVVWAFRDRATAERFVDRSWDGSTDNMIVAVNTRGLDVRPDPHPRFADADSFVIDARRPITADRLNLHPTGDVDVDFPTAPSSRWAEAGPDEDYSDIADRTGLDVDIIERYDQGRCVNLAAAIADRTGWTPVIATYSEADLGAGHVLIRRPDGRLVDVSGSYTEAHLADWPLVRDTDFDELAAHGWDTDFDADDAEIADIVLANTAPIPPPIPPPDAARTADDVLDAFDAPPEEWEAALRGWEATRRIESEELIGQNVGHVRGMGYEEAIERFTLANGDFDVDAFGEAMEETMDEWLAAHPLSMHVPESRVADIIHDGRLRNQWETGTTAGSMDLRGRAMVEHDVLGYPLPENWEDMQEAGRTALRGIVDGDQRPVYGYVGGPGLDDPDNYYGGATFRFRDDIRERSTFTVADSFAESDNVAAPVRRSHLSALGARPIAASDLTEATLSRLDGSSRWADHMVDWSRHNSYIEVQYHGGVTLDDVEEIILPNRRVVVPPGDFWLDPNVIVEQAQEHWVEPDAVAAIYQDAIDQAGYATRVTVEGHAPDVFTQPGRSVSPIELDGALTGAGFQLDGDSVIRVGQSAILRPFSFQGSTIFTIEDVLTPLRDAGIGYRLVPPDSPWPTVIIEFS